MFRSKEARSDYFAVLIDGRQGDRQGTVLQHPLFQERAPAADFQVPPAQLQRITTEPVYDFRDPLAEASGGEIYRGDWIAATQTVSLPDRSPQGNGQRHDTDLLVLVQVKAAAATGPVQQLGRWLALDAAAALGVVVMVVMALWGIVFRISGERIGPWARKPSNLTDLTPPHNRTTLPATPRQ